MVALIITIIILVILTAVVINSLKSDKIVEHSMTGATDYAYEQEKELIGTAIYEAMLQTFVSDAITFDYKKVPENLAKSLSEKGQFQCELINDDDNGKTIYRITPTGKNFHFILKMSNTSGEYDLIPEQ